MLSRPTCLSSEALGGATEDNGMGTGMSDRIPPGLALRASDRQHLGDLQDGDVRWLSRVGPEVHVRHCEARRSELSPERNDKGNAFDDFFGQVHNELIRMPSSPHPSGELLLAVQQESPFFAGRYANLLSWGCVVVTARLQNMDTMRQEFSYSCSALEKRVRSLLCPGEEEDRYADSRKDGVLVRWAVGGPPWTLSVPTPLGSLRLRDFMHVLNAWATCATKSMAAMVPGVRSLAELSGGARAAVSPALLPLKVSGWGSFLANEALEKELATHVGIFSLTSAVMFIGSIRALNKHSTAQEGNFMGMLATALGIVSVMASPGFHGAHSRFFLTFGLAGVLGYSVAMRVRMEEMPELVAAFHSFVGLAAVSAGFASYFHPAPFFALRAIETFAGTAIGALTFTGSVVAALKLHGVIPGAPIILEQRWLLNCSGALGSLVLGAAFSNQAIYLSPTFGTLCLTVNTLIWCGLGTNMVLPIGGADMPVVVSLLNAFSGLATSAAGFMLSNNLLTITGALVASSGTLLSDIMCRGINRSMYNVLLGGFGTDGGTAVSGMPAVTGSVNEVSALGFVHLLTTAKRIVIVPGYGLAVARCQQRLAEIVSLLRRHGIIVHFAIHPVAGRLPGHMNVLLAEADVPYDIVREMEDLHSQMPQYDVAVVVGANDIVNPATQTDPGSPIYGMPAIEVWRCKTCIVLKRSMGTGYSGVDNPLFYEDNVRMLFGDAKQSMDLIFSLLNDNQDRLQGAGVTSPEATPESGRRREVPEEYPPACKVLGVIRERAAAERRVSITPSVVTKFRKMGFSILIEAGAGVAAGFADEDYIEAGASVAAGFSEDYIGSRGVQLAESADEVLKQAHVILKVTAPLLDELQLLQSSQTVIGLWNMFGSQDLLEALGRSMATFINIGLVPRISRAQKCDALTSMANIAGYRAVVDAFNRLPRFSRSSVTACGVVPPAKVFIIGAGVAGLSAIATAHALGAKVYANDVRDAAREQVESMGAEFVPVDAIGVAGEGVGGYATEMGQAFKEAQLATYARIVPDMDIVITTAMIPNRAAPVLITDEMLRSMRRGSVIVDLAAPSGGNCAVTECDGVVVTPGGVTVVGETNYPSAMPAQASEMLGNNFAALLETLGGAADFGGAHFEDPIIRLATVSREGRITWPPAPEPAQAMSTPAFPTAERPTALAPEIPRQLPGSSDFVVKWLTEHRTQLAFGVGAATVLGLGLAVDIPEDELTHIGYFVLSCLIGHFTVAGVTPALHTPLISVTNAISGIIVIGGMLQLSGPFSPRVACALAAVFLSSVNIVGGFAVTHRMLEMFRK